MPADLTDPVLNGPFDPPQRHFEVLPDGPSGRVLAGRRRSESWVPVPAVRKGRTTRAVREALDLDTTGERREVNELINEAFRDTWELGIGSYLTYLRDRLVMARDLLTESGSVFVQIGDENVHLVRSLLDEVFGAENFVSQVTVAKTSSATSELLPGIADYVVWYARQRQVIKYR